ncbi:MAG: hypothetical protein CRN43_01425, partial [Candidatus Nephrothrix sp. EaCA]
YDGGAQNFSGQDTKREIRGSPRRELGLLSKFPHPHLKMEAIAPHASRLTAPSRRSLPCGFLLGFIAPVFKNGGGNFGTRLPIGLASQWPGDVFKS